MRKYKEVQKNDSALSEVICDKCKKVASLENDNMDFHEWHYFHFTGGYDSIFGDGDEFECDFCQQCMMKVMGKYLRYLGTRK